MRPQARAGPRAYDRRVDASYSLYALTEEHELLRKSVRELAEDKIAPRAAEID